MDARIQLAVHDRTLLCLIPLPTNDKDPLCWRHGLLKYAGRFDREHAGHSPDSDPTRPDPTISQRNAKIE
jgi:hypothetical protein